MSGHQCPDCGLAFSFSFELRKHRAEAHNGNAPIVLAPPPVVSQTEMAEYEVTQEPEPEIVTIESSNGLFIPAPNDHYYIERDKMEHLARIERLSEIEPKAVGLKGPTGAGKTSLGLQFAAVYHRPTLVINCGAMMRPDQWFGSMGANESGTFFKIAEFIKACETTRSCVIFDEMNRVENPKVLNPLIGLLDESQFMVYIDEIGRWVHIAPGVVFFATINEGWEYQGTDPVDTALGRRFEWMTIKYPPREQLISIMTNRSGIDVNNATLIANFAAGLAAHDKEPIFIDTRQLIKMSKHVAFGASIRDAFEYTFAAGLKPSQFEKAMGALQQLLQNDYDKLPPDWITWS